MKVRIVTLGALLFVGLPLTISPYAAQHVRTFLAAASEAATAAEATLGKITNALSSLASCSTENR